MEVRQYHRSKMAMTLDVGFKRGAGFRTYATVFKQCDYDTFRWEAAKFSISGLDRGRIETARNLRHAIEIACILGTVLDQEYPPGSSVFEYKDDETIPMEVLGRDHLLEMCGIVEPATKEAHD